jgi:hypothetical protein
MSLVNRKALFGHQGVPLGQFQVAFDHLFHQLGKADLCMPSQLVSRLAGVTKQGLDLGRPEIARVHPDHGPPAAGVDTRLIDARPAPLDLHVEERAGRHDKIAHRELLTRGNDEVLRDLLLQHQPLRTDIVARVAPIAARIEVAEVERLL